MFFIETNIEKKRRIDMSDFGMQFGMLMGRLVAEYRSTYAWLALIPHLVFLVLFYLILRYGNRYRKAFAIYYTLNYVWLLIFVGGWFSVKLYQGLGFKALAMYGGTPPMLLLILYQWIREWRSPRLDLDLTRVSAWRWVIAIPIIIWGFWYPPYEWGVRLIFDPKELLFGAYGLMGCPTTLVPLAILFLKYPAGNRPLFYALTAYATIIGLAMTALLYVPDFPFFFMGLASFTLIVVTRFKKTG
jgi:hypothetical protein